MGLMKPNPQKHPGAQLRALMDDHCVSLPGAFNGLVARAVAQTGFEACYVSGGAMSAAAGVPDVGLRSLDQFCEIIQQVADSSGLPVLADADTGFGEAEMVARTVAEYCRAGAAGLHLEDQVFPKRCGHLEGKKLVAIDHFQEKIAGAAKVRDALTSGSFIICARTDAASVTNLDDAIARAKAYVDAGADMLFPEGLTSEKDFGSFAQALQGYGPADGAYLLANMTEFGKTPIIPLSRFAELGYSCVIFPVTTLRIAMGAVTRALESIKERGDVNNILDQMQTRKELYDTLEYTPGEEWIFPKPSSRE